MAQPLSDVSINVAGQVYPLASNMLLPGAPEVAYTKMETESEQVASGRYFEGCYAFIPTKLTDVFERPDSTRLEVPLGDGEVFEEGYQCKPTIEGCISPADFTHDFTAGVSTGLERFYYTNPDRIYVGSCQKSDTNYTHIAETSSWKYDDPKRKARPLSDVSIRVDGLSYTIATKKLLPGAQYVAYKKKSVEEDEDTSERYYDGCNAMVPVKRKQAYERPDGSKHYVAVSDGTPVNEGDRCTYQQEIEERWVSVSFTSNRASWGYLEDKDKNRAYSNDGPHRNGPYTATGAKRSNRCNTATFTATNLFKTYTRDKKTNPAGEVFYSKWKTVSQRNTSNTVTSRGDGGEEC
ncbi:hypothetical protein PsAD14_05687 [Pseudovibrio sp. Ad14]|nr:hypothetical protein PsAD14_05687 [Pseudovibrio sp. Ad14]